MISRRSLPSRGAWIEIIRYPRNSRQYRSLPSRGAWIEMECDRRESCSEVVAPLAGSVDRNVLAGLRLLVLLRRSPRGERG